jgi:hypothetical protein
MKLCARDLAEIDSLAMDLREIYHDPNANSLIAMDLFEVGPLAKDPHALGLCSRAFARRKLLHRFFFCFLQHGCLSSLIEGLVWRILCKAARGSRLEPKDYFKTDRAVIRA